MYQSQTRLKAGSDTSPLLYQKVLIDSKTELISQKLEEQKANYNQLLASLQDEKSKAEKLRLENERFADQLKQKSEENSKMKQINRELLELLRNHQIPYASQSVHGDTLFEPSFQDVQVKSSLGVQSPRKNLTIEEQEVDKIHSLYQDLYLTDLKNDLDEVEDTLQKEKEFNLHQNNQIAKLQKELNSAKRTI